MIKGVTAALDLTIQFGMAEGMFQTTEFSKTKQTHKVGNLFAEAMDE